MMAILKNMSMRIKTDFKGLLLHTLFFAFILSFALNARAEDEKEKRRFITLEQIGRGLFLITSSPPELEVLSLGSSGDNLIQSIDGSQYLVTGSSQNHFSLRLSARNLDGIIIQKDGVELKRILTNQQGGVVRLVTSLGEEEAGDELTMLMQTLTSPLPEPQGSKEQLLVSGGGGEDGSDEDDQSFGKRPGGMFSQESGGQLPLFTRMSLADELLQSLKFEAEDKLSKPGSAGRYSELYKLYKPMPDHNSVTFCYMLYLSRPTSSMAEGDFQAWEHRVLTQLFKSIKDDALLKKILGTFFNEDLPIKTGSIVDRDKLLEKLRKAGNEWPHLLVEVLEDQAPEVAAQIKEIVDNVPESPHSAGASATGHTASAVGSTSGALEPGDLNAILSFVLSHSSQWTVIAQNLISRNQITKIQSMLPLFAEAPNSFLIEAISQYLRKAPNDKNAPTVDHLASAVDKAGLGRVAEDIRAKLPKKIINRPTSSSVNRLPVLNIPLSESSHTLLLSHLSAMSSDWYGLGAALGVEVNSLALIAQGNFPDTSKLSMALTKWLRTGMSTLKQLYDALMLINQGRIAENVRTAVESASPEKIKMLSYHYGGLCAALRPKADQWEEFAKGLGFSGREIANIKGNPTNLMNAPGSYMDAIIDKYSHWAPGDARGHKDYANTQGLFNAMVKALNYSHHEAHEILLKIFQNH